MEPPSSIANSDKGSAGCCQQTDDPLSRLADSYLIITNLADDYSGNECLVCAWSARTGLSYLGRTGSIES